MNAANIDLVDIALRRPSLDEVFFALTTEDTRARRRTRVDGGEAQRAPGRHRLQRTGGTPESPPDAKVFR
jgi:ABC-2 type transport system ATP-binding protein